MSCGTYNTGWDGGCGCVGTVQYAPPACNPDFPITCTSLGAGTIVRVVGEDSSSCKYTVPTLQSNSILFYNASTALVTWADGSVGTPIFLGNGSSQATASSGVQLQSTTPTGQLVTFKPVISAKTQFPIVTPSGTTTNWGTIDDIVASSGIVYKNASNVVAQAPLGTAGQVLTMAGGVPVFSNTATPPAFIDARSVRISAAGTTGLNVFFGQLVATNSAGESIIVNNSNTFTLNLSTNSLPNSLDVSSLNASTYYYVFAIYNAATSTVATIASLSPTAPTLPTGYTYFRLIGLFRTNASSQIDAFYNQNGRAVNFGQTAAVNVTTQSTQATNLYWSGAISFAPYQYVDKAYFRFSLSNAASTTEANVIISNYVGTTGAAQPAIATTNEVYAAMNTAAITSTGVVYSTTHCVVPNSAVCNYNIYLTAVLGAGDTFTLQISGYELSFL
jgi:hypothetical protein